MDFKDGNTLVQEAELVAAQLDSTKSWLAGDSAYQTFVETLSVSDPRLRSRDPKAITQRVPWADYGRVVTLEAGKDGTFGQASEFNDATALQDHLSKSSQPGRRALYILEGAGPSFVAVLGAHFSLHPSVFVDHERVIVMNQKSQGESDGVPLPSMLQGRDHLRLKYFEPLQFSRRPTSFRLVCGETGRHIGVARAEDRFTDVAVARRKCTTWTRRNAGGGWECLVICDPAVRSVRTGQDYRERYEVTTQPYQGGYVDFVPHQAQIRNRHAERQGPPRSCFLDDLVFYLQQHAANIFHSSPGRHLDADYEPPTDPMADPDRVVGTFVRKIVTSHYFKLAEHLRATLSAAQRALSRKHDLASLPMEKVEELWSDIQAWERRVGEYCEDLEAIMLQLGVPLEAPNTGGVARLYVPSSYSRGPSPTPTGCGPDEDALARWLDPALDLQFLLLRFRELRHRTECLNAAVTGLASITGNRQQYREQQLALETARRSIREAKSARAVTLLGLIFIPLAYTCSVFGMQPPYGPGGDQFWQYFAASVPLIVVVMTGYYVLDWGYTDDGRSWSGRVLTATVREHVARFRGVDEAGLGSGRERGLEDEKGR